MHFVVREGSLRMTTMKDVASRAGVSIATVSRVLNENPSVEQSIRERVIRAATELDYRFNPMARALRTRTTNVVGLVIPDVENPFFTAIARGVEDVMGAAGYSVMLCNSDEDVEKEARYLDDLLLSCVAGVIVAPASGHATDLSRLLMQSVPLVAVDRMSAVHDIDTVTVNNVYGAELAAEYLVDGCGVRTPAIITGPRRTSTGTARLNGFVAALRHRGVELAADCVIEGHHRIGGGFAAVTDLWRRPIKPDGLFVTNNLMAVGALHALTSLGLRAPEDVAVACFDDLMVDPRGHGPIPVVRQPAREIGVVAGDILLRRIQGSAEPVHEVVLDPVWVADPVARELGFDAAGAGQPGGVQLT